MKKPKRNHPWRLSTTSGGHKMPPPDEFYFYDLDDLPLMSNSELVEQFSRVNLKMKQEDSYD